MSLSSAGGSATTFRRSVVLTQHGCRFSFSPFGLGWIASRKTDNLRGACRSWTRAVAIVRVQTRDAIRSRWASRQQARPQSKPLVSHRPWTVVSVKRGGSASDAYDRLGITWDGLAHRRRLERWRRRGERERRSVVVLRPSAFRHRASRRGSPGVRRRRVVRAARGRFAPRARRWPRSWAASSPAASPWRTRTRTRGRIALAAADAPAPGHPRLLRRRSGRARGGDGPADRRRGVESG